MQSVETGDKVRYVDENGKIFDANVQAALMDGFINLRIIDANYDIRRIPYDANQSPMSWHWGYEHESD